LLGFSNFERLERQRRASEGPDEGQYGQPQKFAPPFTALPAFVARKAKQLALRLLRRPLLNSP